MARYIYQSIDTYVSDDLSTGVTRMSNGQWVYADRDEVRVGRVPDKTCTIVHIMNETLDSGGHFAVIRSNDSFMVVVTHEVLTEKFCFRPVPGTDVVHCSYAVYNVVETFFVNKNDFEHFYDSAVEKLKRV